MKIIRHKAVWLAVLLLLPVACSTGPVKPMAGGLRRGRPERVLLETRFNSGELVIQVSPEALITQFIRTLNDQGLTLSMEKPTEQSAKLLFSSPQAKGHLLLDKIREDGMTFTVEYEYRVNIVRFPATEAQEVEVNRLADFILSVFKTAQQPAEAGTTWKD